MSTFIKGQVAVIGLAMVLSAPVFGQAGINGAPGDGKRVHFTDISVRNNNDGKHKMYSVLAGDEDGNTYRMRKIDGRIVELELNSKAVPQDQYAYYDERLGHLEPPPVPPAPAAPAAPAISAAPAVPATPVAPAIGETVTPAAPAAPAASPAIAAPPISPLPPTPPAPPEAPRSNKYISHIIDDLSDKGIIMGENNLTFLLDNGQMTVNGVKQPDNVFQFFKQKYIRHAGDHFGYERHGSTAITNIKTDDDNH